MAKPTPVAAAEEAAALRRRLRRLVAAVTAGGAEGDAFDEAESALAALRAAELGRHKDAARGGDRATSVPEQFLCPISSEIMRDPVVLASGQGWIPLLKAQDRAGATWLTEELKKIYLELLPRRS